MTFLKDRDWKFPIGDLVNKIYQSFLPMKAEKFQMALGDVMREWDFLFIIWSQLKKAYEDFAECEKVFLGPNKRKLSIQERSEYTKKFMHSGRLIHLETENFLIHAEIMLDRVAFLTTFFEKKIVKVEGTGRQPETKSFKALKNWFKKENHSSLISDIEFAGYLKDKTDWFKKLEEARDDLIVHRKRSIYVDVIKDGKAGKAKARFDYTKNIVDWNYIKEMPDLNKLMDGVTEFLYFYDKHFTQMLEESN